MKYKLTFFALLLFSQNSLNAQSLKSKDRKESMVYFLIKENELSHTQDINEAKVYVYERNVYRRQIKNTLYEVFIFGVASSHAKSYVCLSSKDYNYMLETRELGIDMQNITKFIRQSQPILNTNQLLDFFDKIALCYINNKKDFN